MIGQQVLQYQILSKLGAGGMGEVFRAHDTTLDRDVALKFLPDRVASSETDRSRFILEAKAAAALSHPNICSVIAIENTGVGDSGGQLFIVMEFVDGTTLREKIGALSPKQAVEIGIQMADGLAAAHEKGIVHRDIKPENVMVRKDGRVQIMDFGLAKLKLERMSRLTREGSTVGTAGYMAPEQVQGQDTDHRSDIFSLGVVLYEMLTGGLPFKGVHETAMLYEIVNVDPSPMSVLKPDLDPGLDAIVLDCLEKDPKERCQSVAEVARSLRRLKHESTKQRVSRTIQIPAAGSRTFSTIPATEREVDMPPAVRGGGIWKWIAIAALAVAAVVLGMMFSRKVERPRSLHAEIIPPKSTAFSLAAGGGHVALSPSGRLLVFVAVDTAGQSILWVRSLQSSAAKALAGTEEAQYPFWSPDEKSIGYFAHGKMMRIEADGGTPFTLADVTSPRGGTWNTEGTIVYAPDQSKGLYRIPATGGKPVQLTQLDTTFKELTHRWPSFLPDNDHYLFFARGSIAGYGGSETDHIYVGSLSKGTVQQVMSAISDAVYSDGMILYSRENAIIGQVFDADKLRLSGDPVTIAQDIQYTPRWSKATFTASQTGELAFLPGGQESRPDILLVQKDGTVISHIGRLDVMFKTSISPDGKHLAMDLLDSQSRNIDVWIYDIVRGIKSRLTFSKLADLGPIWSPGGDAVAYVNGQGTETKIMTQKISGSGQEEIVAHLSSDALVSDWSSDGSLIIYSQRDGARNSLWVVPTGGDKKPVSLGGNGYNEAAGKFSPDFRWVAYVSDESGKYEIYVRSFAVPGSGSTSAPVLKRQISVDGGNYPVWRSDGKAIFYVTPRGVMLAELSINAGTIEVTRVSQYSAERVIYFGDIHPSGNIIITQTKQIASGVVPMSLIVNWKADLEQKP